MFVVLETCLCAIDDVECELPMFTGKLSAENVVQKMVRDPVFGSLAYRSDLRYCRLSKLREPGRDVAVQEIGIPGNHGRAPNAAVQRWRVDLCDLALYA